MAATAVEGIRASPADARRGPWAPWLLIFPAVGFLFALFVGIEVRKNLHGVDDFNQFYVGAKLLKSGHLYEAPAIAAEQRATIGVERPDISPSRLPFYYALLSPLVNLPYASARRVWLLIVAAAAVLFPLVYPAQNRVALIAASAISVPLSIAVSGEQDVPLALLIFAVAMRLNSREAEIGAGMVLALLAIKFNLFLLLPIPFVLQRKWRVIAGAACSGALLLATSFVVAGNWIPKYIQLIGDPAAITGTVNKPNLHGLLAGLPAGVEIALSLMVIAATLMAARGAGFETALAAAMLGSFLLSRHAFLHDCVILLPILTHLAATARGAARWFPVALLTPFPYFLSPMIFDVRHGLVAAVLIAGTLGSLCVAGSRPREIV